MKEKWVNEINFCPDPGDIWIIMGRLKSNKKIIACRAYHIVTNSYQIVCRARILKHQHDLDLEDVVGPFQFLKIENQEMLDGYVYRTYMTFDEITKGFNRKNNQEKFNWNYC